MLEKIMSVSSLHRLLQMQRGAQSQGCRHDGLVIGHETAVAWGEGPSPAGPALASDPPLPLCYSTPPPPVLQDLPGCVEATGHRSREASAVTHLSLFTLRDSSVMASDTSSPHSDTHGDPTSDTLCPRSTRSVPSPGGGPPGGGTRAGGPPRTPSPVLSV